MQGLLVYIICRYGEPGIPGKNSGGISSGVLQIMKSRYALILVLGLLTAACCAAAPVFAQDTQGSGLFDGADMYKAAATNSSLANLTPAALKEELKKHIVFDDHGSARERAGYETLLSRLMDSPTGREEAKKFIQDDREITFSFVEMPGTTMAIADGRKSLWGTRGLTQMNRVPPDVKLNAAFLDYDMDTGVGTFAHETFGHAVDGCTLSGDDAKLNGYAVTEEENARIIGWLVRTELNMPPEAEIWAYAANPDVAMHNLAMAHPYYSLQLTTDEMQDPLPVYRARLALVDELLAGFPKREQNIKSWTVIIDHFINIHKMDKGSFKNILDGLESSRKALPNTKKTFTDIKTALTQRIAYFSGDEGRKELELLKKGSSSRFLAERDAVIMANREKLNGLLSGISTGATSPPPLAGQVTWDQLKEMLKKDRESCEFGGIK